MLQQALNAGKCSQHILIYLSYILSVMALNEKEKSIPLNVRMGNIRFITCGGKESNLKKK